MKKYLALVACVGGLAACGTPTNQITPVHPTHDISCTSRVCTVYKPNAANVTEAIDKLACSQVLAITTLPTSGYPVLIVCP